MTMVPKTRIIILLVVLGVTFNGCAAYNVNVRPDFTFGGHRIVYLEGDDPINIKSSLRNHLGELGFVVRDDKELADLVVTYSYRHYRDVFHDTFSKFDMTCTDVHSNQIVLRAGFIGESPLSFERIISKIFKKIKSRKNTSTSKYSKAVTYLHENYEFVTPDYYEFTEDGVYEKRINDPAEYHRFKK